MRAVRCCAGGGVELVDVPRPAGDGVRVDIRAAGICGSDLHMVRSGIALPATLGHEFAGVTDDGRVVAVEPLTPCGTCDLCQQGRYNVCRGGAGILLGVGKDGGMADEVRVPERCLVALPEGLPVADGSLVEPVAVAVHGMREAGVEPGMRVAVIGGGSIGLCAVVAAQSMGADVSLVARHPAQKGAGEAFGAGLEPSGEYDVVVDCAGTEQALQQCVGLAKPRGVLLLLAMYWDGMSLPGMLLCMREIRVIPSMMYGHTHDDSDFEASAKLLGARPEIGDVLVTHRIPLDEAPRAFEIAADRQAGAIKVVLEA